MKCTVSFTRNSIFNLRELQRQQKEVRMVAKYQPVLIKAVKKDEEDFVLINYNDYEKLVKTVEAMQINKVRSEGKKEALAKYGQR